jgi:RNA recognition motif-containing protein
MIINSPREELPPLAYHVAEEQPPYSTGHQNLRTFTKIFIHNIDFQITRDSLLRVFAQFGRIKNINMPTDSRGRPRGLAFITYVNHELAANALRVAQGGIQLG